MSTRDEDRRLLTPAEVALAFKVNPKTVTRWAQQGRLKSIFTPGGHRRYYRGEVEQLLTTTENPNPNMAGYRWNFKGGAR
jgi:excisionase family DNA binding protein